MLIVRAGDFFGPKEGNSWFSQGLVIPAKPVIAVSYPAVPTWDTSGPTFPMWREPVRMENARLIAALGQEPHTPLDEADDATLNGLGFFAAFELRR